MRVGILGFRIDRRQAGHRLRFGGPRRRVQLLAQSQDAEAAREEAGKNARVGTPAEAAFEADALVLAVHWTRVDDVLN